MASKFVCDTKAAQSLSAHIVLDKKGKLVAKVQAHFSNGGTVLVNVWDMTGKQEMQHGKAGGYGYDKFTAALSGLIIDGHTMADHCGNVPEDEAKRQKLLKEYAKAENKQSNETNKAFHEKAEKIGCRWANWTDGQWTSLHFISGLQRLESFGYKVIQAI